MNYNYANVPHVPRVQLEIAIKNLCSSEYDEGSSSGRGYGGPTQLEQQLHDQRIEHELVLLIDKLYAEVDWLKCRISEMEDAAGQYPKTIWSDRIV